MQRLRIFTILTGVALLAAACAPATSPSISAIASGSPSASATQATRLVVGALHVGSIKDAGYNQAEHDGLVAMQKKVPGIKLLEVENVPEGPDSERVMENLIQQGAKLIFPQSFGYQDFALNVAAKHPDVKFAHPAGYKLAENFGTYWAASDQLEFALGMAAGKLTKSNKIGFIGGFPIPQIIYSINAFHLGARSVNPNVQTVAVFNSTWVDPAKEATATNALADQGVDVVTMIVDSPITVVQTAEKRGIMSIGYHSAAVAQFAPNGWISGITFNWGDYFAKLANDVINNTWKSANYIGDLSTGMATLAPWGAAVSTDVQTLVSNKLADFSAGTAQVYVGPIKDQAGKVRIEAGAPTDYNLVNTIDWFAEGVVGQTK
jgi:basic membrane protein A